MQLSPLSDFVIFNTKFICQKDGSFGGESSDFRVFKKENNQL